MLEHGPEPDVHSFNAALTACAVSADAEAASRVVETMREREVNGTLWTHTQVINAMARGGELEKAPFSLCRLSSHSLSLCRLFLVALPRG